MIGNLTNSYSESHKRGLLPLKAIFVVLFTLFFNIHFFQTTMLYRELYQDYQTVIISCFDKAATVLVALAILYIVFVYKTLTEKTIAIIITLVSLIFTHVRELPTGNSYLVFFLLLVCSKNASYKLISRIALSCGSFWILYSAIACKLGYISDIVFNGRHSFGSIYVTDLFCHFLTLFMVLCILRNGKLRVYDYLIAIAILLINVLYMNAKVGFLCFVILLSGTFFYQFVRPKCRIQQQSIKCFTFFTITSFILLSILMLLVSYYYSDSADVWYNKYSFFHTLEMRFRFGSQAFEEYEILPWGQYIFENGNGGRVSGIPAENYFFLDISYIKILFINGWVTLLLLLTLFTSLQIKLYRNKSFYALFVLAVFALDCSVEHHIMEISYSLLIYLLNTKNEYD